MKNQTAKLLTKKTSASLSPEAVALKQLSESVGDFIRYWGFRRIHGEIWTQVFLSKTQLSGAEITKRLGVSKSLVSPALSELEVYGLITRTEDGKKTKRYSAVPNVLPVIKAILKKREARMIAEAQDRFESLRKIQDKNKHSNSIIAADQLEELGQMISLAQFAVHFLIGHNDENLGLGWLEQALKVDADKEN